MSKCILWVAAGLLASPLAPAAEHGFEGIVSSASPEATAAGVAILDAGGNAVDAAVAVSLTLGVTEPAGSGIAGQTVMLVKRPGEAALVVQGTTWSPRNIPGDATREQLRYGHTASTIPSTLRVLDLAQRKFGSGDISWAAALQPAIAAAENGFDIGPFRQRAFRNYGDDLRKQNAAAGIFVKADGSDYQLGDRLQQPLLAKTLRRIADSGAMDFYKGKIAKEIAADMAANGGWMTLDDLRKFPEPAIVPAIRSSYRGYDIETLPPPFGGWVVLHILNTLETSARESLATDNSQRRLALLDALRDGHAARRDDPVTNYTDYDDDIARRIAKGETTHFSVVDGDGMAVSVTQSIDSYFGAKVVHPTLGFLYNNYMQGFQVDDPAAPYYLVGNEMPLSSMSATIVSEDGQAQLVLGSPGSARIISAVAQVVSHWIDVGNGVVEAVAAYRVHVVPDKRAYVEGPEIPAELLGGMAARGFDLARPAYGVSDSQFDAYFGGVHALALENGRWTGAADPRRDGTVGTAGPLLPGMHRFAFDAWHGPAIDVRVYVPDGVTATTPIVMVMHGWSREAERYFDDWSAAAGENQFIAVVPHFPVRDFPGSNEYNLGHVFKTDSNKRRPRGDWTFAAIELLFDEVVARVDGAQTNYTLYGHSAGSQFVHRFLYYMPEARVKRYIAANAGWYTLPDLDTAYPYGLKGGAIGKDALRAAFGKDVVLLLGREDTDAADPNLRNTPEARRQGANRFARGLTMLAVAKSNAAKLGADLNWRIVIVDGADHSNARMTPAAAVLVE